MVSSPLKRSHVPVLAEALNSLYKAELVRNKGPWNSVDDLEIATAQWVHWYNTIRPHSAINMHTPEEHENAHTPPPPEQTRPHTPQKAAAATR